MSQLLDLYNHVHPNDEIYGDADDLAEIPTLRPCPPANLAHVHADSDKSIDNFGHVRDFVASTLLVWRLSGDAVGEFDLAEQCHDWGSWICFNRERW